MGQFEQAAALWATSQAGKKFEIGKFLSESGVLILGNDPTLKESIWPLNAMLLKALTDEILRRPDTRAPRFWFVLDEFSWMKNVTCIHDLFNRGRSKGASVLIGIQTVEGLIEVYNEQGANDILSQCAHKTFLRAGGPKTAQWAEQFFAKVRQTIPVLTEQFGKDGRTSSVQHSLKEHSLFIASEFLKLPFPGPGKPYCAINDVPSLNCTLITRRDSDKLFAWTKKPRPDVPSVERRSDPGEQTLWPWDAKERKKFCQPPPDQGLMKEQKRARRSARARPPEKSKTKLPERPDEPDEPTDKLFPNF